MEKQSATYPYPYPYPYQVEKQSATYALLEAEGKTNYTTLLAQACSLVITPRPDQSTALLAQARICTHHSVPKPHSSHR